MRIAVLGTGMVGTTLGSRLIELGHQVVLGSRTADNEAAIDWAGGAGPDASQSSFSGAAQRGELVINATSGTASLDALGQAGAENLAGKVLIDVANPIADGSVSPPRLAFCNTESLGEKIQAAFPEVRVVKALNTVNAALMVDPGRLGEPTSTFICGNDSEAKGTVTELLQAFGWEPDQILDLGPIAASRGLEMYLSFWLRVMSAVGNPFFNVRLVRGG